MGNLDFDSRQYEPQQDISDPLAPGWYNAHINSTEIKESKANPSNRYVKCEYTVTDGPYKGRKFWDNLNLWNSNSDAQNIARGTLEKIRIAAALPTVENHEDLRHRPMRVRLDVRAAEGNYKAQNVVKDYEGVGAVASAPSPSPAPVATQQAQPATAPWAQ